MHPIQVEIQLSGLRCADGAPSARERGLWRPRAPQAERRQSSSIVATGWTGSPCPAAAAWDGRGRMLLERLEPGWSGAVLGEAGQGWVNKPVINYFLFPTAALTTIVLRHRELFRPNRLVPPVVKSSARPEYPLSRCRQVRQVAAPSGCPVKRLHACGTGRPLSRRKGPRGMPRARRPTRCKARSHAA